jgi:hypothetical protein
VRDLFEAITKASAHRPIVDFTNPTLNQIIFEQSTLELVFERDLLEDVLERAGLCERVFFPGGPYGPGGTRCFAELNL